VVRIQFCDPAGQGSVPEQYFLESLPSPADENKEQARIVERELVVTLELVAADAIPVAGAAFPFDCCTIMTPLIGDNRDDGVRRANKNAAAVADATIKVSPDAGEKILLRMEGDTIIFKLERL